MSVESAPSADPVSPGGTRHVLTWAYPCYGVQHRQRAPGDDKVDEPLCGRGDGDVQRSEAGCWDLGDVDPAARAPAELEEATRAHITYQTQKNAGRGIRSRGEITTYRT